MRASSGGFWHWRRIRTDQDIRLASKDGTPPESRTGRPTEVIPAHPVPLELIYGDLVGPAPVSRCKYGFVLGASRRPLACELGAAPESKVGCTRGVREMGHQDAKSNGEIY
jgi:hypothetical protein